MKQQCTNREKKEKKEEYVRCLHDYHAPPARSQKARNRNSEQFIANFLARLSIPMANEHRATPKDRTNENARANETQIETKTHPYR